MSRGWSRPGSKAKPASVWAVPELNDLIPNSGKKETAEVCFVAPLGKDCTTAALEAGLDPQRTVAVDPLFGFKKRRTLMSSPATTQETARRQRVTTGRTRRSAGLTLGPAGDPRWTGW